MCFTGQKSIYLGEPSVTEQAEKPERVCTCLIRVMCVPQMAYLAMISPKKSNIKVQMQSSTFTVLGLKIVIIMWFSILLNESPWNWVDK